MCAKVFGVILPVGAAGIWWLPLGVLTFRNLMGSLIRRVTHPPEITVALLKEFDFFLDLLLGQAVSFPKFS